MELHICRRADDFVVALSGNPNVGKSTVFNALTGLKQHTGNWPGKTVTNAQGRCDYGGRAHVLVDVPGTYSLLAHSAEEECARDFVCFGGADAVIVVCDATCLERNLNLVLQTIEVAPHVVLCLNLMDEAKKKQIHIDLAVLQAALGVPVVACTARSGRGLTSLLEALTAPAIGEGPRLVKYLPKVEAAIAALCPAIEAALAPLNAVTPGSRWLALRLLENDESLCSSMEAHFGAKLRENPGVVAALSSAWRQMGEAGLTQEGLRDQITACLVITAEGICAEAVCAQSCARAGRDRKLDRILVGKWTGFPVMLLLLALVFWVTISGANAPSKLLFSLLFALGDQLELGLAAVHTPAWLSGALVMGVYRVLAWVVSVMLPPMAIFFPLFTLLEDLGYLPRVAFNLDKTFKKAHACGKQALTMCMGFGCNAAGVVGCRIIDSPRERLIAIITNNFVPCNGRFAPPH